MLDITEKNFFIHLAKETIYGHLKSPYNEFSKTLNSDTPPPFGCFVSVYVNDKLRGCIGRFFNKKALIDLIKELSISSAFNDTRFTPIHKDELQDLTIEISVLSALKKINNKNEIVIGKHGIYIKQGISKGTLLPQVAPKNNWSVEEFLAYCSKHKAGIGWDGWKRAEVFTYTAEVFKG